MFELVIIGAIASFIAYFIALIVLMIRLNTKMSFAKEHIGISLAVVQLSIWIDIIAQMTTSPFAKIIADTIIGMLIIHALSYSTKRYGTQRLRILFWCNVAYVILGLQCIIRIFRH